MLLMHLLIKQKGLMHLAQGKVILNGHFLNLQILCSLLMQQETWSRGSMKVMASVVMRQGCILLDSLISPSYPHLKTVSCRVVLIKIKGQYMRGLMLLIYGTLTLISWVLLMLILE
ncbi:hypothetical protein YA31_02525 [Klebsiella aerogenes]|nr:hypothetical protein YA31_02525 [Klebsiella aerogenes]